jgi:hypothetical protein
VNLFDHLHDKSAPLDHVVSYRRHVPLERGLCYCIYLVGKHGFEPDLLSASRDMDDIAAHNRGYGTNLHGQQWLIDAHARDPQHFAPANSVDTTSHCLHSDGNSHYRVNGKQIPARGRLPWYMRGIDMGTNAQASKFCQKAREVGLVFVQPYNTGSELHHVVCVVSPYHALVDRGIIHTRSLTEAMEAQQAARTQLAEELRP